MTLNPPRSRKTYHYLHRPVLFHQRKDYRQCLSAGRHKLKKNKNAYRPQERQSPKVRQVLSRKWNITYPGTSWGRWAYDSFVVTYLKTRRPAGLKKEVFEETLKTAGIPAKYICRSFATWDILLPSEDLAKKLAINNITTKFFRLQPEYKGKHRIKVTVCNVSMQLNRDVLTVFLSSFGGAEDHILITSVNGTAYSDYVFTIILDRGVPRHPTHDIISRYNNDDCWG